jgi:tetratricopeptide (TPR) repeat protein
VRSPIDPELINFLANPLAEEGSGADEAAFQAGLQLPEETVADLLQKASAFYSANALTTPQGNNAYESYQHVLAIDPSNSAALLGIDQIVEKYKELAEGRLEEAEFDAAESLVHRAIRIAPDNAQLPELLSRIDDERIKKEAEELLQQINQLLALAAEKVRSGDLITPDQDNALFYYQQVLALDPGNTTARSQLQIASNQKIPEIDLQISQGQFDEARELIEISEQLYPANPDLIEPKKRYSDLLDVKANGTGPHITDAGMAKPSVLGQIFSKDDGRRLSMYFTHKGFSRDSPPLTLKLLDSDRSTVLATENIEVTGSSTRKIVNFQNEAGFENGWYELDVLLGEHFLHSSRFELAR